LARARGKATPVVDLNRLLGEASAGPGGRFVSLRVDERRVILAVDAAREIRSLDDHAFEALPPLLAQSAAHLQGLAVLDGRLLAVLDASKLLSALPDDASVGGSLGQG
jgi:chemotaxis signal transduction protein